MVPDVVGDYSSARDRVVKSRRCSSCPLLKVCHQLAGTGIDAHEVVHVDVGALRLVSTLGYQGNSGNAARSAGGACPCGSTFEPGFQCKIGRAECESLP